MRPRKGSRAIATVLPMTARTIGRQTATREESSCLHDFIMTMNGTMAKAQSQRALDAVMTYVNTFAASMDTGPLLLVIILNAVMGKPHLKRKRDKPLTTMAAYMATAVMIRWRCHGRNTSRKKKIANDTRRERQEE